ncbi:hypothetical protein BJ170DRAFT_666280 [Xylariales sp. AK1849]|nr:hypothetical protein BJ170DRAFT_666280 [Xylariales sp. AK1849]
MALSTTGIGLLPNEILIQVLEMFPTGSLLPLAAICHSFYALVSRVHYNRLVEAIALQDHEIILECYHPSVKISTPYLFCNYLGTDGLQETGMSPTLRGMSELYSRFRPVLGEENRRARARYPTRMVIEGLEQPIIEFASHDIHLDASELFSQLCTVINLVKVGPRHGLFLSCVNIIEGVIRVWRDWLAKETVITSNMAEGKQQGGSNSLDSSILWVDPSSANTGLRLRVVEKPDDHTPVLLGPSDEPPISYVLEYDELLIRSNQLLKNMEQSEADQVSHVGKAIVIATM